MVSLLCYNGKLVRRSSPSPFDCRRTTPHKSSCLTHLQTGALQPQAVDLQRVLLDKVGHGICALFLEALQILDQVRDGLLGSVSGDLDGAKEMKSGMHGSGSQQV